MNKNLTLHNHIYLKDKNEDIYFLEERNDGLHYCILDKDKEILKEDIHLTQFLLRLDTFNIDDKPDSIILKKRTYTFKIYKCINKVFSLNDMKFEYIQGSYPTHLDFNKYLDNDIQISIWIDEKLFKRCMYSYIAFLIKNIKNNEAVINAKNRTLVENFIRSFLDIIENSRDIYLENFFNLYSGQQFYSQFFNIFHIHSNKDLYLSIIHDTLKPTYDYKELIQSFENYKKIGYIERKQDDNREAKTFYYLHYKSWYNLVVNKEQSNAEYSFKTLTQDIILWELYQLGILYTINSHKPTVDEDLRNIKNWKYKYLIHKVCKSYYCKDNHPLSASMLAIDVVKMYESVRYPYIEPSEELEEKPNICRI